MSSSVAYVVMGAKMKCSKGSKEDLKINLPVSHGSYAKGKPIMIKTDRVVGENIGSFEKCKSCGECHPEILQDWMFCKEDTLINGTEALVKISILICAKGGIITFETDGQDD